MNSNSYLLTTLLLYFSTVPIILLFVLEFAGIFSLS